MTTITRALFAAGLLALAGTIAWWWLTYRDVIAYAYMSLGEAGVCLVQGSDVCRLARSLCRGAHPLALFDYREAAFWVATALLCAGLVTGSRRAA